ncbi:hypothetical protein ACFOWX_00025 [Sphingorhabdus arenilitoris]|uniref:Uncharacterized protein n=1 Tax=Sphingorhabdus arenilitoris TaxID=1490041 RepID=A0ABV8REX9_9SPHN
MIYKKFRIPLQGLSSRTSAVIGKFLKAGNPRGPYSESWEKGTGFVGNILGAALDSEVFGGAKQVKCP